MEPEGIALRMTAYPRENSGELAAFERIMSQCERRVLRVALRLLNNPQDAQDAAQEVFLRLYKHLGDLDETRGYGPWLYRVTVNVCRDIAADVNGHAVQPRSVPARLVQIAEMLVEPQENFLGGILGVLRVIQQAQRDPEDPTLALRHDPLEGSQLAGVFPRVSGHAQRNSFRLHF